MSARTSTYCVLPWNHLASHPQGMVSLCCRVDFKDGLGMAKERNQQGQDHYFNLADEGIQAVMNSQTHREARIQMLKGERPAACRGCYQDEDQGLKSKRQRENEIFRSHSIESLQAATDSSGQIEAKLEYLELRLGRKCNLKCRTCNPSSSSSWAQEYKRIQAELPFVREYGEFNDEWTESEKFWLDLSQQSSSVSTIYINGGEPTLNERHWWYLRTLIELGRAREVELLYNINMTVLPDSALEIWRKFKKVHIGASIDDVGVRNRYIRSASDWNVVLGNLRRLRDSGLSVGITQTVSAYNFFYLDELFSLAERERVGLGHNYVYDPEFLSVEALPLSVRTQGLLDLKKRLPETIWNQLNSKFSGPDRPELWPQFRAYTLALDRQRNESFEDVFSEFVTLLNSQDFEWTS